MEGCSDELDFHTDSHHGSLVQSTEWEGSVDNLYGHMVGVEPWDMEGCSDELDFHKRVLC